MSMKWDPTTVKAQLRLASQRLAQVQARNDALANITRKDIATLLQRSDVSVARDKAEKLILDEAYGDFLEELVMQIGVLLEHFFEVERGSVASPVTIEAASTVIYSAPYVQTKDLDAVRALLGQRLGPDFTHSAAGNRNQHVSRRALKAISVPIPSALQLDSYMLNIAESYNISWLPEAPRNYNVNALSEILDLDASPEVDMTQLKKLCNGGLPDEPVWLRPRVWKLLFGILPPTKSSWKVEIDKQRQSYYDLIRRLLEPVSLLQAPSSSTDSVLIEAHKELSGLPKDLWILLDDAETFAQCPLHEEASEEIRIPYARTLETRLKAIHQQDETYTPSSPMPEIRLETESDPVPAISLTPSDADDRSDAGSTTSSTQPTATTLLPSRKRIFGTAHPVHCSALLRLLYLHNVINPGNVSLYTSSYLVPLYSALVQEVNVEDLAHAEADTFWVLEAMVAEFTGLEDEEGRTWMNKFSDRVAWADFDYKTHLESFGLDPTLPHYSYRWLMPLLSHTLPQSSLFLVWDVLFSRPAREKESNPKLEYLLDICTSMLIRSRHHLTRLRNSRQGIPSLWTSNMDYSELPASGQAQEGFMEALSFLQHYNPKYVGGIERILQTSSDLSRRREQEVTYAQQPSFGSRFKVNMSWRGFGSQQPAVAAMAPSHRQNSQDFSDGNETEPVRSHQPQASLSARVSNTFWRGITNQSAMDDEMPSIPSTPSPDHAALPHSNGSQQDNALPSPQTPQPSTTANIWGYAEKLKSSDAVASLSKASSNWRAKAMMSSWTPKVPTWPASTTSPTTQQPMLSQESPVISPERRGSLPFLSAPGLLSPPAVPPKDASPRGSPRISPAPGSSGVLDKTKSMMRSPPAVSSPKSGPRPLLLNSGSPLISGKPRSSHPRSVSAGDMQSPDTDEWAEVMRAKYQHFHRDSQSSVSSLSPSDAFVRVPKPSSRADYDSDNSSTSRVVPLNRRSVSPMAPNFRINNPRPSSRASSVSSDIHSPPLPVKSPLQHSTSAESPVIVSPIDIVTEATSTSSPPAAHERPSMLTRKMSDAQTETSDSDRPPMVTLAKSPRVRARKYPRPANLQIQDTSATKSRVSIDQKATSPSSNNLTVDWPTEELENINTPRAAHFDAEDHATPQSVRARSPRRVRKLSATNDSERLRKSSTDTIMNEDRPRKTSTGGNRVRKVSTGSREAPRRQSASAAEEGDDEGYDDLLSAYESEDTHTTLR